MPIAEIQLYFLCDSTTTKNYLTVSLNVPEKNGLQTLFPLFRTENFFLSRGSEIYFGLLLDKMKFIHKGFIEMANFNKLFWEVTLE